MRLLTLFALTLAPLVAAAPPGPVVQTTSVSGGSELGIQATDLTPELRQWLGVKSDRGVLVGTVQEGSAAAQAGLEVGDVITVLGGDKIEQASELFSSAMRNAGATVPLRVVRDGREQSLSLALPAGGHYSHTVTLRTLGSDTDSLDAVWRELTGSLSDPLLDPRELEKVLEVLDPESLRADFEALERAL